MGFRETLNKFPNLSTFVAALGILAVGLVIWFQVHSNKPALPRAFYSIDDGQSFFEDSPEKLTPFEYQGKQAVGAVVYAGKDGKPFVAYLTRIDPTKHEAVTRLRSFKPGGPSPGPKDIQAAAGSGQVKRPGDKDWISESGPGALEIKAVKLPDGTPATRIE